MVLGRETISAGRYSHAGENVLTDALSRPLRDLRISVTDRCNLRCSYCMPRDVYGKKFSFLPMNELLSFEEIHRLSRLFVGLGVRKIRLTGGEPMLRHRLERLIEKLALLEESAGRPIEIAMTTNGTLLASRAQALKDAGLSRLTVSLDALSETTFRRMTDSEISVGQVLEGIAAAQAAGLAPIKVNTVIRRGINEDEIIPLVSYFRNTGIILRVVEFMDVGTTNHWKLDEVVSSREIVARVDEVYSLAPFAANYQGEVARRWRFVDGAGEIGTISSVTQPFCGECTRLRLSTDGKLYGCLFAANGEDLRATLRESASDLALRQRISGIWLKREDRYSELRDALSSDKGERRKIEMSYIGG
ncbi:MAG: GTP 3',8-cyclase MoaA [Candidatus Accumulibacter sp.]|nr:GTP 3',8-cyclase MoaA [Accumulibacter sp.]